MSQSEQKIGERTLLLGIYDPDECNESLKVFHEPYNIEDVMENAEWSHGLVRLVMLEVESGNSLTSLVISDCETTEEALNIY